KKNKKIVMTNGCFDILHPGHLHLLSKSKILGDYLIVAVNTDVSIKRLKGKGRPINNLMIRMRMLTALKYVDFVVSFDEDTPENLYKNICPDILTKGSDYKNKKIVGEKDVLKNGGKVILINHLNGFSTTKLIHKYDK
ncbi:MAG TPA: D-glycero-beta-D-manno-heptose 1-phosphate adenylyltransferase, partial [Candidatus Latescibacteria bacterium]|nr:D-glycero-beta-D-manno-heptose 1-phosphate adenylyltransferase [Candidatus Latescibacterota bacterium]